MFAWGGWRPGGAQLGVDRGAVGHEERLPGADEAQIFGETCFELFDPRSLHGNKSSYRWLHCQ